MIDDDNHSKIFISEKSKYCIEHVNNRSINISTLSSCNINVLDLTDNYYKFDIPNIKKYCTILLIDDNGKIVISEKSMYYIKYKNNDDDWDKSMYYEILNDFDHFKGSVRNNIVNFINSNERKRDIFLLVDDYKIFICRNDIY